MIDKPRCPTCKSGERAFVGPAQLVRWEPAKCDDPFHRRVGKHGRRLTGEEARQLIGGEAVVVMRSAKSPPPPRRRWWHRRKALEAVTGERGS
jgi:hypothetical protein